MALCISSVEFSELSDYYQFDLFGFFDLVVNNLIVRRYNCFIMAVAFRKNYYFSFIITTVKPYSSDCLMDSIISPIKMALVIISYFLATLQNAF